MAKRGNRPATTAEEVLGGEVRGVERPAVQAGNERAKTQDGLVDFAEDLGAFLGTVQGKASSWLEQRKVLADRLTQIRDTANEYLQQLTGQAGQESSARRGRPPGSSKKAEVGSPGPAGAGRRGGKRKRTMSPEARERIAAAQRARWAKVRKGQGR